MITELSKECNDGWLEPILDRIAKNQKIVAVPIVATINNTNFAFQHDPKAQPQIGGHCSKMFEITINRCLKL